MNNLLIDPQHFILATRDSGYRSTASAVSELVDNAIEANARHVRVYIYEDQVGARHTLSVLDNGHGMTRSVLRLALQFGGTTRFNARNGAGRFGMGLPNSSLSQTTRVEVHSWRTPKSRYWCYLDVDEIASGYLTDVPVPRIRKRVTDPAPIRLPRHGTLVTWHACDRLSAKRAPTLKSQLHRALGQIFRLKLLSGFRISVNDEPVVPFDPLFLRGPNVKYRGTEYGPAMVFDVRIPGSEETSRIHVLFSLLPIEQCYDLPNAEKRELRIARRSGVYVLRSGREIDRGWYFMGRKRRENYDDWWRCEVQFEPTLDEMFGVSHTKQWIRPSSNLVEILKPHIESTAHKLNFLIRKKFQALKDDGVSNACRTAAERDYTLEPPGEIALLGANQVGARNRRRWRIGGLKYRINVSEMTDRCFFAPTLSNNVLTLSLNADHPFYKSTMQKLEDRDALGAEYRFNLEMLLLSASRAELAMQDKECQRILQRHRLKWSDNLASFVA